MKKILFLLMISALCVALPASVSADQVGDLFNIYVPKLKPDKVTLIISDQPDSTGFINKAYLEADGAIIEKVNARIASIIASVNSLQLNPPSEWGNGRNMKFKSYKSAALIVELLEEDINAALEGKTFNLEVREDENDETNSNKKKFLFHDVEADITAEGIKFRSQKRQRIMVKKSYCYKRIHWTQ